MKPFIFLLVFLLAGCTPWPQSRMVKNGESSIDLVRQFSTLIPSAIAGVGRYEGIGSKLKWRSVGGLHERYVVKMYFPVSVNWVTGSIQKSGPARFMIFEVESVEHRPDGLRVVSYTRNQRSFGEVEWAQVVAANGDWSAIGFSMTKNDPIKRFDQALRSE
jgi:hypothetical protein